jgi:hypothetical protein
MAYNFQTGKNKIKILTKYVSVTQKVLLLVEAILQNAKQIQHVYISWHIRFPRGIQFPSKCSPAFAVFPVLFGAEHSQFLEIALINVKQHYLKVHLFHIEFRNDVTF